MSSLFYFVGIFGPHPGLAPPLYPPAPYTPAGSPRAGGGPGGQGSGVSEKVHKKERLKLYDYFRIFFCESS